MEKFYLGIDLGTSSVKVMAVSCSGGKFKAKAKYPACNEKGFFDGVKNALDGLFKFIKPENIVGVAISSQVGSYFFDGKFYSWQEGVGKDELKFLKENISESEFIESISMAHPNIVSYPLPRLLYFKKLSNSTEFYTLKEKVLESLIGVKITDKFTQRGIYNLEENAYPKKLLEKLSLRFDLPKVVEPTDKVGVVTDKASKFYGLKEGTPVYAGCNDFFAGLLGLGVLNVGEVFELSGTSEHLGVISSSLVKTDMVSGPYFNGYATYGGTKASGVACDFAMKNFGLDGVSANNIENNPPIFLPYLTGERAPIFDENAKGVFFGITDKTSKSDMAYAVLEGVVFSLYDIYKGLNLDGTKRIICGGGSAVDGVMNAIKAELFCADIVCACENDTSALGACAIAMAGDGLSLKESVEKLVEYYPAIKGSGKYRQKLLKRFAVYKGLYSSLKENFIDYKEI